MTRTVDTIQAEIATAFDVMSRCQRNLDRLMTELTRAERAGKRSKRSNRSYR